MLHDQLQLRWQQLNGRERLLVSLAGIVLAISVVYFALWQPLQNGIEQRQLQRDAQLETLSWVRKIPPLFGTETAVRAATNRVNATSGQ